MKRSATGHRALLFLMAVAVMLTVAGCGGSEPAADPSPAAVKSPAEAKNSAPAQPASAPKVNLTESGGTEFSAAWAVQQVLTHCRSTWNPEAKLLRVSANTTTDGLIGESMVDFWMVFLASPSAPAAELCGGYVRRGRDAVQNGIGPVTMYTPGHSWTPTQTLSTFQIDSVDLQKQPWWKEVGWNTFQYDLRIAAHFRSHPAGAGLPKSIADDTPVIWVRQELTSTNSVFVDAQTGKLLHKNF